MINYILFIPGSWLIGYFPNTRDKLVLWVFHLFGTIIPQDIITKYQKQFAIHFTHIIPGAIWSLIIPFQFHIKFRKNYRVLHRYMGYTFIVISQLMTIGVFIIINRGLLYENFFPDLPPRDNDGPVSTEVFLSGLALWFSFTSLYSVRYATSKQQFHKHQIWIIRHVSSGIWVILQRLLIPCIYPLLYYNTNGPTRSQQRELFGEAGQIAIIISLIMGEITIYLLKQQQKQQHQQRKLLMATKKQQ